MNRSIRRMALASWLLVALVLAACQRDRPAASQEGWSTPGAGTPGAAAVGTPSTTSLAAGTPLPGGQVAPGGFVTGTLVTPLAPVVLATPTPVPALLQVGATFGYVVKSGDTLFSIALTYDTDVETIRRLNNLPDDSIQIGQVLIVPGTGEVVGQPGQADATPTVQAAPTPAVIYVVESGDNLSSIAIEFGVAWQDIALANNIQPPGYTIYRGQKLVIPGVTPTPQPTAVVRKHVVQPGETLYGIAVLYGTTVQALMEANGLADPNLLQVNQELIIP